MKNKIFFQACIALSLLCLSGCSSDRNVRDLKDKLSSIKQQELQKKKLNPLTELKMPRPIEYGSATSSSGDADQNDPMNALDDFPLSAIQFVGTLTQDSQLQAFVMVPNNMVYQVKIGDTVGDHHGKISKISHDQIEVIETKAGSGNKKTTQVVLLKLKE